MKVSIFTTGLVVLLGCIFYSLALVGKEAGIFAPINLGYFIVVAGAFISVALFRSPGQQYGRVRYEVYRQLASGGMTLDELMEKLSKDGLTNHDRDILSVTVGLMLDQGHLVIAEGRIKLAEPDASPHRHSSCSQDLNDDSKP